MGSTETSEKEIPQRVTKLLTRNRFYIICIYYGQCGNMEEIESAEGGT
jgi:hypothetical protein